MEMEQLESLIACHVPGSAAHNTIVGRTVTTLVVLTSDRLILSYLLLIESGTADATVTVDILKTCE